MTTPTTPVLQVTPVGLRELAQRCQILAGQVAPFLSAVTVSAWQATGAATSTINTGASRTAAELRTRMRANAGKLDKAAHGYASMDDRNAIALSAVGAVPPAGSSADGGSGGLGIAPVGLSAPRLSTDGGAAELGIPR